MIKAVIFDLDGTLIDSEPNYYLGDKAFLEHFGVTYTLDQYHQFVGVGGVSFLKWAKNEYKIPDDIKKLTKMKDDLYLKFARKNTQIFPVMLDLLNWLESKNMPMAIASGSTPSIIKEMLKITKSEHFFKILISSHEVKKGKPAPDVFIETALRLRVDPTDCLVFEDSQYGVQAAKAAGMKCIGIPTVIKDKLSAPFYKADLLFEKGISTVNLDIIKKTFFK